MCVESDYVEKMAQIAQREVIPYIDFYELISHLSENPETIPFHADERRLYESIYSKAVLSRTPTFYMLFPDGCHPNPTGHRALAKQLMTMVVYGR